METYWLVSRLVGVLGELRTVEIEARREPNRINPEHGRLSVAVLTEEGFNANQLDTQTIRFGPAQAESISERFGDIDRDGDTDLILQFATAETGITCGDTEATLIGETLEGVSITGTDSILCMGCR